MVGFRVRVPLHKLTTTYHTIIFPNFVSAGLVIDRWPGIITFKGLLIRASHALGGQRIAIIGVFHTPMWSLGSPRAFFDSVPAQVLNVPALQLNSGIGD